MSALTRRRFSLMDKLKVMVAQAICPLCERKLGALDGLDWDHAVPLALGGADDVSNLRAVHRDCHKAKTFGLSATTAGSDTHTIAKVKRLAAKGAEFDRRLLAKTTGEEALPDHHKHRIPSRPFPKRIKA